MRVRVRVKVSSDIVGGIPAFGMRVTGIE